ncbi:MAG TPA: hypothetical protein VJB41_00800 [Patescibacteria group bacterium]|nr:hypothetical protein [Patescibacteria group bacterium]
MRDGREKHQDDPSVKIDEDFEEEARGPERSEETWVMRAPEAVKGESYENIGRQRAAEIKQRAGAGWRSLKERVGGRLSWLKEKAVSLGQGAKELGGKVKAGAEKVFYGALAAKEIGQDVSDSVDRKIEKTKEKYGEAQDSVLLRAKEGYGALEKKGRKVADGVRERVDGAKSKFDAWRNERRRAKLQRELDRATDEAYQADEASLAMAEQAKNAKERADRKFEQMQGLQKRLNEFKMAT